MGRMPRSILLLFLIIATSLLSACASATSADPGVVTIALDQPPENLDPRIAEIASSQRMVFLMFNSLVKKNEQLEIVPDLAINWDMPDQRTYVFHLRKDVKFHDGRPLTSKDVVFTF